MSMDAIEQVTQTERRVQEQLEAAAAEGRQLVAEAQRAGQRKVEESRQRAEAEVKALLERAEEEGRDQAQAILAQMHQDQQRLAEGARQYLDEAAALIAERVVRS